MINAEAERRGDAKTLSGMCRVIKIELLPLIYPVYSAYHVYIFFNFVSSLHLCAFATCVEFWVTGTGTFTGDSGSFTNGYFTLGMTGTS